MISFEELEQYEPIAGSLKYIVRPLLYVLVAIIVYEIIIAFTKRIYKKNNNKKRKTVINVVNNIIKYAIAIVTILSILSIYGVDTTSLIASLGIAGLAVGFALQDLLQDFIAGVFLLFDNTYVVGDNVTIDGFRGDVVGLGLKTTKIRDVNGNVLSINNGSITKVINHSLNNQLAVVDVDVAYEEDLDHVLDVMKKYVAKLNIEGLSGDINVLGVTNLGASGVTIRVTAPCESGMQFSVERELRKDLKMELDRNNISIPYTQVVVHNAK